MKKMNKNGTSILLVSGVLLFAILFALACAKEPIKPNASNTKNKAEYNLEINGDSLIGQDVSSNWDSDLGIIWLGNDEDRLPTSTLTVFIDTFHNDKSIAVISSAILSKVDQLVGTGEEINAKNYFTPGEADLLFALSGVEVGANYISGTLSSFSKDRDFMGWLMEESKTGEIHMLTGTFTAIVERP